MGTDHAERASARCAAAHGISEDATASRAGMKEASATPVRSCADFRRFRTIKGLDTRNRDARPEASVLLSARP